MPKENPFRLQPPLVPWDKEESWGSWDTLQEQWCVPLCPFIAESREPAP